MHATPFLLAVLMCTSAVCASEPPTADEPAPSSRPTEARLLTELRDLKKEYDELRNRRQALLVERFQAEAVMNEQMVAIAKAVAHVDGLARTLAQLAKSNAGRLDRAAAGEAVRAPVAPADEQGEAADADKTHAAAAERQLESLLASLEAARERLRAAHQDFDASLKRQAEAQVQLDQIGPRLNELDVALRMKRFELEGVRAKEDGGGSE